MLTDDEDEVEEPQQPLSQIKTQPRPPKQQVVINRILESSSSSQLIDDDPDKTVSDLGDQVQQDERNSNSTPLFSSKEINSRKSSKKSIAATVVGSFSDEELSEQMSGIHIQSQPKQPVPRKTQRKSLRETIAGPFSDDEEPSLRPPARPTLAETVVDPETSSDDDEFVKPPPQPTRKPPKPSLPDTVIGFTESMSEMSINRDPPSPVVEEENFGSEVSDSEESEVIVVSDSEDEVSQLNDNDQPPLYGTNDSFENCSSVETGSSDRKTKDSDTTLNKFFNNPPVISDPQRVVSHSFLQRQRFEVVDEVVPKSPSQSPERRNLTNVDEEDIFVAETDTSDIPEENDGVEVPESNDIEVEETPETPEPPESNGVEAEEPPESNEIVRSEPTPEPSQTPTITTRNSKFSYNSPTVNISAKININLKISMRSSTDSSSSESSSSSSSDDSSPDEVETPKRNEKQVAKPGSSAKKRFFNAKPPDDDESNFHTPTKKTEEPVIDEDLQKILDNLYGESWKTPQLLKSVKKSKTIQKDLRKSIAANNFENFVKNLPRDLESTRITKTSSDEDNEKKSEEFLPPPSPKSLKKKTPASSTKKMPKPVKESPPKTTPVQGSRRRAAAAVKPKYLDICDSDTTSGESSDEDFNPEEKNRLDDTWNASSDEEYPDEAARIRKSILTRPARRGEELVFVSETPAEIRQKKLDDLADRFEYTKPPGMDTPKQRTKKKLFTHSHYDDDDVLEVTPDSQEIEDNRGKENKKIEANLIDFKNIFIKPAVPVVPTTKKTVKKVEPKKPEKPLNSRGAYSFLKSLDVEANPAICHPEALIYRNNYKSKKAELTQKLFALYNEKVFDGDLKDVPIKWNKKLLNTAGRCNNSRRQGVRQSELELSDKVLTSADRLRCTLIHEMCHAVTWVCLIKIEIQTELLINFYC